MNPIILFLVGIGFVSAVAMVAVICLARTTRALQGELAKLTAELLSAALVTDPTVRGYMAGKLLDRLHSDRAPTHRPPVATSEPTRRGLRVEEANEV